MKSVCASVSNSDVEWHGGYIGYAPTLVGEQTKQLVARGERSVPELLAALSDPEAFVAAHVLLTQISGVQYEAFPTWNSLRIEITADGSSRIDVMQRDRLSARWRTYWASEPRPHTLPEAK